MPFDGEVQKFETRVSDPVLDHLIRARKLIETPERWCKKALRKSNAYCAVGAIHMIDSGNVDDALSDTGLGAWFELTKATQQLDIPEFNNRATTTHADILALFDRAIESRAALATTG